MPVRLTATIAALLSYLWVSHYSFAESSYALRGPIEASLADETIIRTPSLNDHNDGYM
ncbi:hypothetical protein [Zhongshania sp.]|uniref:hypothetical protein n=1 Tax=Zhongshania sp. TaxID=1971902 RepID=UPI0035630458